MIVVLKLHIANQLDYPFNTIKKSFSGFENYKLNLTVEFYKTRAF